MHTHPSKLNRSNIMTTGLILALAAFLTFTLTGCSLISFLTGQDEPSDAEPIPDTDPVQEQPVTSVPDDSPITATNPPSAAAANGFVINLPAITYEQNPTIPGRVGVGSELYIDGKTVPVNPDGTFNAVLDLTPGENTLYIKVVTSGKGVYSTGRKIVYKPKPPLTLERYPNPYVSESPVFVVKGNTGPNSQVEVNGVKGESDNNGNFMVSITLEEGENVLNVSSVNADGIKSTLQATVTYNKPAKAPLLVVTSPTDNGYVSSANLTITGVTDPDNLVEVYNNYFVANKEVKSLVFSGTVKNGNFAVNVTLSEGQNELIIRALDSQGQTAQETRRVTYKKDPDPEPEPEPEEKDTEPPVIEFYQVSPIKISRSTSSTSGTTNVLKIVAKVTDNDSGVDRVIVEYYNPEKTNLITIELEEKDRRNAPNQWTGERTFSTNDRTGEYTLHMIYVYDNNGNWKPYSPSDLKGNNSINFTVQ